MQIELRKLPIEMERGPVHDSLCVVKRVDPSLSQEDKYRTMFAPHREHISSAVFTPIISVYY